MGLIVVQLLGALSLIPYPAVLIANVMGMAGEGPRGAQRLLVVAGYGLLSLYPLVWIALFVLGWRALRRGATGRAFAYSALPLVATLVAVGFLLSSDRSVAQIMSGEAEEQRALVMKENPLVWTILCTEGANRLPGATKIPVDAVVKAVRESDRLNDPAPPYGTPLGAALHNLKYKFDGTHYDSYQNGLERVVRALADCGARLSAEENEKLDNAWRLKRALYDGKITTREENPLVYKILQIADPSGPYMRHGEAPKLDAADQPLLNQPTPLHGTPLYTALRLGGSIGTTMVEKLIYDGARLSAEEGSEPAGAAALRKLFEQRPDLRTLYER